MVIFEEFVNWLTNKYCKGWFRWLVCMGPLTTRLPVIFVTLRKVTGKILIIHRDWFISPELAVIWCVIIGAPAVTKGNIYKEVRLGGEGGGGTSLNIFHYNNFQSQQSFALLSPGWLRSEECSNVNIIEGWWMSHPHHGLTARWEPDYDDVDTTGDIQTFKYQIVQPWAALGLGLFASKYWHIPRYCRITDLRSSLFVFTRSTHIVRLLTDQATSPAC